MPKKRKGSPSDEGDSNGAKKCKIDLDVIEVCQDLYDILRSHKSDDGHLICENFIRAPNRRSSVEYYDIVTTPMDLIRIQQKLKTEEYTSVDQMTTDVELLVSNAKAFYKKNTQEHKDAINLWELYSEAKNNILNPDLTDDDKESLTSASSNRDDASGSLPSDFTDDDNPLEELFAAVMTATDLDARPLSDMFQLLPSRTKYPDYFKVIEDPLDLKTVATKIQGGEYLTLNDLEKDLLLIVKNAKHFNEPGSLIYKDAVALRKVIINKKLEIDNAKSSSTKTSERIRQKRLAGSGSHWSSIVAALQYDDDADGKNSRMNVDLTIMEDDEDGNDSEPEDADSNPQWQLFEAVRTHTNISGYQLSEPFMRLPSRKAYPDYYKEIKIPISLANIKAKIKTGMYASVNDVSDELKLMFENAKKYNRPDSRIYKDAVKLQKYTQIKAKELATFGSIKGSDSEVESIDGQKRKTPKKTPPTWIKKTPLRFEDSPLKKRLRMFTKTLLDFVDETGRTLIGPFIEKPARKDYPDYYEVIQDPVDMKSIEINIRNDKYQSQEAFLTDMRLMFNNCRQYNEETSQIYRDANTLERLLLDKVRDLSSSEEIARLGKISVKKVRTKPLADLNIKLKKLYEIIQNFVVKGRKLSVIFQKLPSKTDYPDYYEVIKRPLDMQRIQCRLLANQYESLEDILADFVLMFDNACKYNEPDSQIYKDALTLQRVALQTKLELIDDSEGIPDVRALVQELLTNLFISVYNHQDEESRCYSDSLVEIAEVKFEEGALNLDKIKRNLNRNQYRRLDRFQEDMFEVFEMARRVSRTDSQAFEDSVELQAFFIKIRDELCRNGELLLSPALSYTEKHLMTSVEKLRMEKLPQEEKEVEEPQPEKQVKEPENNEDSVTFKEQTYRIGDFVYIEPRDKDLEPHIIHLEKLSKDNNGETWIYGCWFYRPNETFHLATRKFMKQEVFKSDNYNGALVSQIIGKCYVMFVKDYFKMRPENFEDKDVYVCESRYSTKAKAFKKIKVWLNSDSNGTFVNRDEILSPVRVPSAFKEKTVVKVSEQSMDNEDGPIVVLDKIRPNIEMEILNGKEGCVYYEQYNIPAGTIKVGDTVLVRTESRKHLVGRIDQMWVDKNAGAYFHGPWFVTPQEVQHPPTRLFYKQEVFLSSIEDTNPLLSIVGKCAVLDLKDYTTRRPTEIQESDVFVCESRYMEVERQIRKLPKGLKKPQLSNQATDDEIYFFRKPITPQKESSPFLPRMVSEYDAEDSNELPPIVASIPEEVVATPPPTPVVKKKTQKQKVTGYIMYASEVRKSVSAANPDSSFGEISRLVGLDWKNLSIAQKGIYEEKAQKQNEENAMRDADGLNQPQSPASASPFSTEKHEHTIYECQWENCDFQFEDFIDISDHVLNETTGHLYLSYQRTKDFHCRWQNCTRLKKSMGPFPNMPRLIRHVKDVHVKVSAKVVPPENRNKNFMTSSRAVIRSPDQSRPMTPQQTINFSQMAHPMIGYIQTSQPNMVHTPIHQVMHAPGRQHEGSIIIQEARPAEPIFVPVPPKPQRLLHSEIYLKYIEGLNPETKHVSNWDKNLRANQDNTSLPESGQLPVQWLGNGVGNHGNAVNALWALREFMVKDALGISKVL